MGEESTFERLLTEFKGLSPRRLRFPARLEDLFWVDREASRSQRLWLEGLIGILLYACFTIVAVLVGMPGLGVRALLVLPVILSANFVVLYQVLPRKQDLIVLLASCFAGSCELFLTRQDNPLGSMMVWCIVSAVLLFINGVMRLRRVYVFASLLWALCASVPTLLKQHDRNPNSTWLASVMVTAFGVLVLMMSYSQDREARIEYLKTKHADALAEDLARSNQELSVAALTDELTGVPNRAALEAYLSAIWEQLAMSRGACSALMIDVDHFKAINDRYGHLYGDRVLKRVATLMAEALRRPEDFVARFGGEEFVILLPHTPTELANVVAERLRALVELAGLPALRAEDPTLGGLAATVSCGVATVYPHLYPDPEVLLAAADEAMYQAKRGGRNRVCGPHVAQQVTDRGEVITIS